MQDGRVNTEVVKLQPEHRRRLNDNLMLFFTGVTVKLIGFWMSRRETLMVVFTY